MHTKNCKLLHKVKQKVAEKRTIVTATTYSELTVCLDIIAAEI